MTQKIGQQEDREKRKDMTEFDQSAVCKIKSRVWGFLKI